MQSKALALIAASACIVFVHAAPAQVSQQREQTIVVPDVRGSGNEFVRAVRADPAEASRLIVTLTNAFRRQQNLTALGPAPQLASAARYFADFMARTSKYGHSADGQEPAARAKRFGYEYCIISENISYRFNPAGFASAELANRFVEGWQSSAGHRKNMVDPNVTETAVAVAYSAKTGGYYAVQLFGRPNSQSIEFSVANRAENAVEYAHDGQTFSLPPRATRTHQVCKRADLEFRGKTLQPVNGQKLVIVNDRNGMQLQAQ